MIQTIVTYECARCESLDLVKNGHDYKGAQKYHCKSCGRYGTLQAQSGYATKVRNQVKYAVLERLSLRGIERIFGLSRRTVSRWLRQWMTQVPSIGASLAPAQLGDVLELDELGSFVGSKAQERWLWLALCRRTRQVVAYWLGDRSENSAIHLWRRLPADYRACASFSDRWAAYEFVFDRRRHQSVDKQSGRRPMSSAGSTPCASVWLASPVEPWLSPNAMTCMMGCCVCLSTTTICHVSVKMSPLPDIDHDYLREHTRVLECLISRSTYKLWA